MHGIVQNHLEKMLENRLPQQLRQQVEDHLTGCADCREAYAEALETSRLLKLLASDEAPEPGPGFSIKVMESIQATRGSRSWLYFPALRELGFAMAAFLLLLGGYYVTVQATDRTSASAEMLLDMPAARVAPVSAAHQHHDPAEQTCPQCWQQKQSSTQVADDHANRERVIASLAAVEVGD